jgi:phosphonate transport system permease protein
VAVILTLHLWMKRSLAPLYLLAALIWLPPAAQINWTQVAQFFTFEIVPSPLRGDSDWGLFWPWLWVLIDNQVLPGLRHTLIVSLLALVATAAVALLTFPLVSRWFGTGLSRSLGHSALVILRSVPEYVLAFVGLLLFGPSMLPAIAALALHNGAIVAHLIGHYSNELQLREDACVGINRYFYEVLPRISRNFLAFTLYRFEILLRESAILGMLGIPTLGFFIDSAFAEFRLDRAILLIGFAAALNILVDAVSRRLRLRLHLSTHPEDL